VFIAAVNQGEVTFIELYAKNDKDREDSRRIRDFLRRV
jgi:hypothetical protein